MSKTVENTEAKETGKSKTRVKETPKPSLKRSQASIATRFNYYISMLVYTIITFMIFYVAWADLNLIQDGKRQKAKIIEQFSNLIISDNLNGLVKGSYNTFDASVSKLVNDGVLFSVYILDETSQVKYVKSNKKEGNKIIVGNNAYIVNNMFHEETDTGQYKSIFGAIGQAYKNLYIKLFDPYYSYIFRMENNDFIVITSYLLDTDYIFSIYRGYIVLTILFLAFAFWSARVLAKMVTKPVNDLNIAVHKFSEKDLSYRIPIEVEDEIGRLAIAFNNMANELEDSYRTLEEKVKLRTLELESSNQELDHKNKQVEEAYKELKAAQVKLVHSEKMSSLGQLVAGVAHELNNPINFIYGNMEHLKNYTNDMKDLIGKYMEFESSLSEEQQEEINEIKEDIDYQYLLDDLNDLLSSCKEGAERTRQIVLDLRNFSRLDEASLKDVNIHEGIDSTLNILHNSYKNRVDIVKDYGTNIPMVSCYAGQVNQVFMNLLSNAAQAIKGEGEVKITTRLEGDHVKLIFSDNGCGIPADHLSKIFDPFFTTKDVGEGTGLGLSVSYGIIQKHNGTISVDSEVGKGTTFTIKLPLKWRKDKADIYEPDTPVEENSKIASLEKDTIKQTSTKAIIDDPDEEELLEIDSEKDTIKLADN